MSIFPQEIIDKIILYTDKSTIMQNRYLLSKYALKKTYKKTTIEMIEDNDIECINYNKFYILNIEKNLFFNKIIIYSNKNTVEKLLKWCYFHKITSSLMTIKIILLLNPYKEKEKIYKILELLYYYNYKFHIYHYILGIEWNSIILLEFLISKNIKYYEYSNEILDMIINKKDITLFKWCIDHNMLNYSKVLIKVILTRDKTFIKQVLKLIPLTYISLLYKKLKENNIDSIYIKWVLLICLAQEETDSTLDLEIINLFEKEHFI